MNADREPIPRELLVGIVDGRLSAFRADWSIAGALADPLDGTVCREFVARLLAELEGT